MTKRYKTAGRKPKPSRGGSAADQAELLRVATEAREGAYAPYSNFSVGAAVRAASGRVYAGCNVENAFYEAAHAEQAAVIAAIGAGERTILAVAIVGGPAGRPPRDAVPPCGFCRQWIFEFAPQNGDVTILGAGGSAVKRWSLRALLPEPFGPSVIRRR